MENSAFTSKRPKRKPSGNKLSQKNLAKALHSTQPGTLYLLMFGHVRVNKK
jgi:hypothetical protein